MLKIDGKKYIGVLAFDYDGVIASYKRPFDLKKLGTPNYEVIKTINYYYSKGYYILLYTGRPLNKLMERWLERYSVSYHGFNINPLSIKGTDNYKPYVNIIVDDKAINVHYKENKKTIRQLIKEIDKVFKRSQK